MAEALWLSLFAFGAARNMLPTMFVPKLVPRSEQPTTESLIRTMLRNTSRSSFIGLLLAEYDVHGSDRHRVARELQAALSYEAKEIPPEAVVAALEPCGLLRWDEDRRPIDARTASALTDAVTVLVRDSPNQPAKVADAIVSEPSRHLGPLLEPETSALLRKALAPMLERDLWDRPRTLATLTTTVLEEIVRRARIVKSPAIGA